MTQDEFSKELIHWREELTDEIIPYFRQGKRERGIQAFGRWKERFRSFLNQHTSSEAERFKQHTTHHSFVVIQNEHPHDEFMREDGNTCLAFIDELADAAQKKRIPDFQEIPAVPAEQETRKGSKNDHPFVDPTRLNELRSISSPNFDLGKLIQYCEELNSSYSGEAYLAVAMLVRSILDHIPPIFGCKTFAEVANNYGGGTKSFKESMQHLENSSRKIADAHLHSQIRKKEVLPNKTQVNFANDLDVLLAEIIRILKP